MLPASVGAYEVLQALSPGSNYADYAARHRTLGHAVMLRHERWPSAPGAADTDTRLALEGLRRARRLQAELQHPHILPVIDFFQQEGEWFSVFAQLARARSLDEMISSISTQSRPPCSLTEFVTLSAGITGGLAAIHRAGFVHRTLGAHNVLVTEDGHVLVSDTGCATPIGIDDDVARAFRWAMRPISAAPEQFTGDALVSTGIDTWALGITLFELRYGRHPFWTDTPNLMGIQTAILTGQPDFPPSSGDAGDELLQPWLRRLLEHDPQRRYADAMEAQRDLQAIATEIEGKPPLARAFVAMPFAPRFEGLWRAIRAACSACSVAVTRVDQSHARDSIWDEICDTIRLADFTIAVATPDPGGVPNPNVMLEIGFARASNRPVLLMTEAPDMLPFDLRTQRALVYEAAAVGGGAFHRELVAFVTGLLTRGLGRGSLSGAPG